ncbi:acetoacetate decarboxylase family protein [Nocardia sp. NPDC050793]|uniref:acetoacetate decarboxylase family protein n=1 Tax=Nocardia sp. NPDC050793 TaxID=3155159 RepID=UPI0033CE50F7
MELIEIMLGDRKVPVIENGYYDRYRMNPDLDEIQRDPAVGDLTFFRRMPKRIADSALGPMWTPNFYYRTRSAQLLFAAPLSRLRAHLPAPLEPVRILPGIGLIALALYRYEVCDNDPYNEVGVAAVVHDPRRKASARNVVDDLRRRVNYAHVLALPVNTEIARLRGVDGYNLPKWRTDIDVNIAGEVYARVAGPGGRTDIEVGAKLPAVRDLSSESRVSTTKLVHTLDGTWHETITQANPLATGARILPSNVRLHLGTGPLSDLLTDLGVSRALRLEVIPEAQLVLHLPRPLAL